MWHTFDDSFEIHSDKFPRMCHDTRVLRCVVYVFVYVSFRGKFYYLYGRFESRFGNMKFKILVVSSFKCLVFSLVLKLFSKFKLCLEGFYFGLICYI